MRQFIKSGRFKAFLVVFAALIMGVLAAAASQSKSSPASSALGIVFSPLNKLTASISNSLEDFSIYFRSAKTYSEKAQELEQKLADTQLELVDYEQTKQKVVLYEQFLELKTERPEFEFASARIIASDSSDYFGSFTVDKGSADNVAVNDPVIYGKYLVGVVVTVKPTYCVVNTVFNPEVNVSAYEVRSREQGFATTSIELAEQGQCRLSGLERTTAITPGSIICTSGIGGIFPADLILGVVTEVLDDTRDISSYAVFEPQTDMTRLRDVFIITDFRGQGVSQTD